MPRAYVYTAFGGPENETFTDLPRPVPGPGQLLVAVRTTAVNPVDWKRRSGYLPIGAVAGDVPAVFGSEAAGVTQTVTAAVRVAAPS